MSVYDGDDLPRTWSAADKRGVIWSTSLPGVEANAKADHNQSSPIVVGDRVFVTVSFWPAGAADSQIPEHHVACYQAADGKLLWDKVVPPGPWKLGDQRGGYTAPTPACDGERVYVVFGSAVAAALSVSGELLWRYEYPHYESFDVAIAASPIVHDGQVLLLADKNNSHGSLTALDAKSGAVAWEQARPQVAFAHSTPTLATIGGRKQLLVAASNALQGLDPSSGKILWWVDTQGDVCTPTISDAESLVYVDSGRGGPGVLVDPTGTGDVTSTHVRWRGPNIPEGLSSPVIVGDFIYRLHTPGVLKCLSLKTGEQAYAERLDGVSSASCPIATKSGAIYFASSGKTFVVAAGPKYELLSMNDLEDESSASAAAANGRLYLKGRRKLYCLGKQP